MAAAQDAKDKVIIYLQYIEYNLNLKKIFYLMIFETIFLVEREIQ